MRVTVCGRALSILIVVCVSAARAQSVPAQPETTIRVESQEVLLDALVENRKNGQTLDFLTAKDFQLSEDGTPQSITYCSRDQLPLSVVLMFDMTETVHSAMKPLARAALEILGHLKPQDEVAVMTFSSRVDRMTSFTLNRARAAEAIKTASWMADVEGTFLDEDMYEAAAEVDQAKPGNRRVLVWLTDGTANFENASTRASIGQHAPSQLHSRSQAMHTLMQTGAVVALLIERTAETNRAIVSSGSAGVRLGDFEEYAKETGGPVLNTSATEAPERLAALIDLIRARYTIGYRPAHPQPANTFCKLTLQLNDGALRDHPEIRKKDVVVISRTGYYR